MNKKDVRNLEGYVNAILPEPHDIPHLKGHDIFGETFQLFPNLGGDHIIFVDFKRRFSIDTLIRETLESARSVPEKKRIVDNLQRAKTKVGILVADVSGHDQTDVVFTYGFHQAFLTGVAYELKNNGDVTRDLIDILNNRFVRSSGKCKYVTLIYAEFFENGDFKFISAGHPLPLIFSREQGAVCNLHKSSYVSSLPMSMFHTARENGESTRRRKQIFTSFSINSSHIPQTGDMVMLYTDGFSEHRGHQGSLYFDQSPQGKGGRIQDVFNGNRDLKAKDLYHVIKEDLLRFGTPRDDISFVIIKREKNTDGGGKNTDKEEDTD
jgi:serine phosphatase RsbU (regulator of sigma subunit)